MAKSIYLAFSLLLNEEDIDTSSKDASCEPNYVCVISSCRCGGTSHSPALTSISSYSIIPESFERWHVFKWIVISSWHSRNLHTVSEPRKPPQLDFPKPEKEDFTVSVAILPLVCFVSSPGELGMKFKVTHISTLIWTGLNRFVSDSARFICKEKCFICPRNFTAMS